VSNQDALGPLALFSLSIHPFLLLAVGIFMFIYEQWGQIPPRLLYLHLSRSKTLCCSEDVD
jgi:hypothetical protein